MKKLQILGAGCASCERLAELTGQTADALGLDYELSKVKDINEITSFGVMTTPALVVDGEVKVSGRVPSEDEIKEMITS